MAWEPARVPFAATLETALISEGNADPRDASRAYCSIGGRLKLSAVCAFRYASRCAPWPAKYSA